MLLASVGLQTDMTNAVKIQQFDFNGIGNLMTGVANAVQDPDPSHMGTNIAKTVAAAPAAAATFIPDENAKKIANAVANGTTQAV